MGINLTVLKNRFYHYGFYRCWVWVGERLRVYGDDYFSTHSHMEKQVKILEDSFDRLSDNSKNKLKKNMEKQSGQKWWKKYYSRTM